MRRMEREAELGERAWHMRGIFIVATEPEAQRRRWVLGSLMYSDERNSKGEEDSSLKDECEVWEVES